MEALNFCRQIRKQVDQWERQGKFTEVVRAAPSFNLAPLLNQAVKFTLPHNGVVLDDPALRGLDFDQDLRLPFPVIALECMADGDSKGMIRVVVLAMESGDFIKVVPWMGVYVDGQIGWSAYPQMALHKIGSLRRDVDGTVRYSTYAEPDQVLGTAFDGVSSWRSSARAAVTTLIDFLNVMSCSNVTSEKLPARKSSKTLGALPFDEYHVLTIAAPQGTHKGGAQGSHRSPREHLRRGHIRRLQSGSKIWVNAAVINAGVGGKIRKQYALA